MSATLEAMRAEVRPGCCLVCDRPIPAKRKPGRRLEVCKRVACHREYQRIWVADKRAASKIQSVDYAESRAMLAELRGETP